MLGSVHIPPAKIFHLIFSGGDSSVQSTIFYDFRLPKALSALLIGSALSVAGVLMQTMFRNPLAGPYVLGVSSGASLAVAVLMMSSGIGLGFLLQSSWSQLIAAMVGAMFVLLLVLGVSFRVKDSVSLLIIGIMLAGITSSFVSVLQYFSDPLQLKYFLIWTFGSLSGIDYDDLYIMAPVVIFGLLASFFIQKSLNTLLLGDHYSSVLGVRMLRLRVSIILISGILAGTVTAFAGPIVFLGVAVPHLARSVFNSSNHRIIIPASILIGASLLLFCDMVSQLPNTAATLPINTISSLIGAPVVIWIIIKNKRLRSANF